MSNNTFTLLTSLLHRLADAHVHCWVFGGWAEELWGMSAPRPHGDIDLLYPATNFVVLDHLIEVTGDMVEIRAKQFSHKRAVMYQEVMVEWRLLEPDATGYVTQFFDARHTFHWPHGTLTHTFSPYGQLMHIASRAALVTYRQQMTAREHAYHAYLAHHESA